MGDLASIQGDKVIAEVEVLGPSWVEADTVVLYQNGYKIRERQLSGTRGKGGLKAKVK